MTCKAVLHVISDKHRHHLPLHDALVESAAGGADVLQIRDKKTPASEILMLAQKVQEMCLSRQLRPALLINDRVDVAIALQADGVHLAAKSLPVLAVRSLRDRSGWQGLIGCSVHAYEEARAAAASGVDYLTYGHIFASESHRDLAPRGLMELARIVKDVDIPVIAIGGITSTNVLSVLQTGVSGVAVIGSVLDELDPKRAASVLKQQMSQATVHPKICFPVQNKR